MDRKTWRLHRKSGNKFQYTYQLRPYHNLCWTWDIENFKSLRPQVTCRQVFIERHKIYGIHNNSCWAVPSSSLAMIFYKWPLRINVTTANSFKEVKLVSRQLPCAENQGLSCLFYLSNGKFPLLFFELFSSETPLWKTTTMVPVRTYCAPDKLLTFLNILILPSQRGQRRELFTVYGM
jgi:hypothetical protein